MKKLYLQHYLAWVMLLAISRYPNWSLLEIVYPIVFAAVSLGVAKLLDKYYLIGLLSMGLLFTWMLQ